MKVRDVLGLGCASLDELLFVEHFPAVNSKIAVRHREKQGGGLTATALVAGARLGAKCAYAGMLGTDETSRFVIETLAQEGVDTALIPFREGAAPVRSTVIVAENEATRTILFERPVRLGAAPDAPSEAEIAASRVLFIDHYGGAGNVRAAEIARRHGIPIVADFERTDVPDFAAFFGLVDHLIVARSFAEKLSGQRSPGAITRALWTPARQIVIVTDGAHGAHAFDGQKLHFCPAFPTQVVDTTGCGDVFHGVYAATLAWNFPLQTRLQWASAAASIKAQHIGAQSGIPRRAAVEALIN